jgi:pimeloyl-ACP methyl ester carboxylesterase
VDDEVLESYLAPLTNDAGVRRDLRRFLRSISPRHTLAVAQRHSGFEGPVLLAWAPEDKLFPFAHAERLATLFPDATLREVPDSWVFVPEDRPEGLAEEIEAFLLSRLGTGGAPRDARGTS